MYLMLEKGMRGGIVWPDYKAQHKCRYFEALSVDLYKAVHKRNYYRLLCDDLAPIAWHPDRVIDWCYKKEKEE